MRDRLTLLLFSIILPWSVLIAAFSPVAAQASEQEAAPQPECVILLHGLGRTARSMDTLATALKAAGFHTVNLDYPSREQTIDVLASNCIPDGIRQCRSNGAKRLHFVTHSMGGILVRDYLSHHTINNLGRVVMLSPPNQGSEIADTLADNVLYQWYHGPAGQQLGTESDGFVAGLGPVDYPVGVITGNTHAFFDTWFATKIPGEDDGKVSVERARVEGMADFLVVPYSHPFIMQKEAVADQVICFLRNGIFHHPTDTSGKKPAGGQRPQAQD